MTLLVSGFETELTRKAITTDTTLYVDSLPTGMTTPYYLMIDAGESTAEIVKVTATGTSPNTLTVTRKISLTSHTEATTGTAYDHQVGAKIALTDVHLYFDDKQVQKSAADVATLNTRTTGNLDGDLAVARDTRVIYMWNDGAGAWQSVTAPTTPGDASSTVKGITKLSVNPAVSTNPIALGQNDTTVLFNNADQTMDTDKKIQFRDAQIFIHSSSDGVLDIDSDVTMNITAPTINFAAATKSDFGTGPVDLGTGALTIDGVTTMSNTVNISGANATLQIAQTKTTGNAVSVSRNLASASTDAPVVVINQDHTGDDQPALQVRQDGTGHTGFFNSNGVLAANNYGIYSYSNAIQANSYLFRVHSDNASSTADMIYHANDGTGSGITLEQNGVLASNKYGVYIYSNAVQVNSELVRIINDNASTTADVLKCFQDGTGHNIVADQRGVLAAGRYGLYAYSNVAQVNSNLFKVHVDHASSTTDAASISNDGTGNALFLDHNNTGATAPALDIDTEQANDSAVINIDLSTAANAWQVRKNTDVTTDVTMKLGGSYYWTDTNDELRKSTSAPTSDTDGSVVGRQFTSGSFQRTAVTGSGNEDISLSFTPKAVWVQATISGVQSMCTGQSDGTNHGCISMYNAGSSTENPTSLCISLRDAGGTLRWSATASFAVADTLRFVFTENSAPNQVNVTYLVMG